MSEKTDLQLHRGYEAGNYAAHCEGHTSYVDAVAKLSPNRSEAYLAAFTLGFFSSCERHEMSDAEAFDAALASDAGKRCVALGFVDRDHEPLCWHVVTGQGGVILGVFGESLLSDAQECARRIGRQTGFAARVEQFRGDKPSVGASFAMLGKEQGQ